MPLETETEPPIRVAVDVRPLTRPPCGMTIHLTSIIDLLRRAGFPLTLITNRPVMAEYGEVSGLPTLVFGSIGELRWELEDLPKFFEANDFELYFTNGNRGIPWRKNPSTRYILGLLDIIPYKFPRQYYLGDRALRLRADHHRKELVAQLLSTFRADAILTISQQSARDIATVFRRRNVTACLIRLRDVNLPAHREVKDQFAYVGGVDHRKKVDVLIRAFALFVADHPNFQLFLVGSDRQYRKYLPLIEKLGLTGRVVLTGFVSHEEKFRIIGESVAMVYPSLYEGYGLALAEAMQAGIPVVAGRGGSQAEVGGDAVRYVDPTSAQEIACAMGEMLDPAVREGWVARGREQLKVLTDPRIETRLVDYFVEQGRVARGRRAKLKVRA